MFSLFRKKGIGIGSVSIPDFGWKEVRNEKSIIQWINPEQTIAVSVNFFDSPPDLPTVRNINTLRDFYRQLITGANRGLIEVELTQKNKKPLVRTIFKLPQQQSGVTYIASLTLPFQTCSFVFKVQAAETGLSGMREALIASRLMSQGIISINKNGYANWNSDLYDQGFQKGFLMNKSEQIEYDA